MFQDPGLNHAAFRLLSVLLPCCIHCLLVASKGISVPEIWLEMKWNERVKVVNLMLVDPLFAGSHAARQHCTPARAGQREEWWSKRNGAFTLIP